MTPVNKPEQRHQKQGLGISGHQEERGRMGHDGESSEKAEGGCKLPALAEEKKVTPKTKSRDLGRDQQRLIGFQAQSVTEDGGQQRIGRKKTDVANLHDLVVNGRHGRQVPAVHDVHEPEAVVLHEGGIAVGKRAFRGEQTNGHHDLRQGHEQPAEQGPDHRLSGRRRLGHRKGREDTIASALARFSQRPRRGNLSGE
jgi:hypothetical protein